MLIVAVCSLGKVTLPWAVQLAVTRPPMGQSFEIATIEGMSTHDARNTAVMLAASKGADFVMFWDDDVIPRSPDAVRTLLEAMERQPDIDVIGGVYPARRGLQTPVVSGREEGGVYWGWEDMRIHPVYMVGTGYMMIRIECLQRIPAEEYEIQGAPVLRFFDRDHRTDDFYFADKCREAGIIQNVHGGVICDQISLDGQRYSLHEAVPA